MVYEKELYKVSIRDSERSCFVFATNPFDAMVKAEELTGIEFNTAERIEECFQ
jgi:hypothetical protein